MVKCLLLVMMPATLKVAAFVALEKLTALATPLMSLHASLDAPQPYNLPLLLDWVDEAANLERHCVGGFACAIAFLVTSAMCAVVDLALDEIGWALVEEGLDLHMHQIWIH